MNPTAAVALAAFVAARRCRLILLAAAFAAGLPAGVAQADELPRWELGAGLAAFHVPDYRGADEGRAYLLPLPYFVYRGERLRADRDGLRGELFESDRVELNLSAGLAVPVRAGRNAARRGMPRLDPVLEVGPSLGIRLAEDRGAGSDWRLSVPLRAAFAVDDWQLRDIGFVLAPRLRYTQRAVAALGGATLRVAGGPNFSSRAYHRYVYDVPAAQAAPARPAYTARGGYAGLTLSVTADRAIGAHRFYAYAAADSVRGAEFDDSPLVRRTSGFGVGIAYVYVFASGGAAAPRSD